MPRHEADREDIMREAVALRRRVSLVVPGADEPIVCGVRANGYWSFYLDSDPLYQFDDEFRLRRAFVDGQLYRTQGTTLARMHRERSDAETVLVRVDLSPAELAAFLTEAQSALSQLLYHLKTGDGQVIETIPSEADVMHEAQSALESLVGRAIELAPAGAGRG